MNKNRLEQKTFLMTAEGQYNKPRAVYVNTSVSAENKCIDRAAKPPFVHLPVGPCGFGKTLDDYEY